MDRCNLHSEQHTSATIVEELRPLLAQFGLPKTVVIDNGLRFNGAEFEEFLSSNGIKYTIIRTISSHVQWTCQVLGTDSQERIKKNHLW